ncbi:MAG: hypothetical protein CMJ90_03210 [Planctomycetes bacterium]|nr:hypothetical protein [Planctomycetota bacterium]
MVMGMGALSGSARNRQAPRIWSVLALIICSSCGGDEARLDPDGLRIASELGRYTTSRVLKELSNPMLTDVDAADILLQRGTALGESQAVAHSAILMAFREGGPPPPTGFAHVVAPKFRGRVAIPDPATCSAGFVFVAAVSRHYGWGWFERLRRNDALVLEDQDAVLAAVAAAQVDIGIVAHDAIPPGSGLSVVMPDDGVIRHPIHLTGPDPDGVVGTGVGRAITSPVSDATYPFDEATQRNAARQREKLLAQFRRVMTL